MESVSLLLKLLWAPGEAMSRIAKTKKFLAPILLLTLSAIVSVVVTLTSIDPGQIAMRSLEQSGRAESMTPEQKTRVVEAANSTPIRTLGIVAGVVGPLISILFVTTIYFGLFTLLGREGGFRSFFGVTAFAFVPMLVRQLAALLTIRIVPQSSIMVDEIGSISPSIFLDRTAVSKSVFTLVNQIDVISIWILVLLVIGYRFVLRKNVSVATRTICVFGIWAVYVALRVALSSVLPG